MPIRVGTCAAAVAAACLIAAAVSTAATPVVHRGQLVRLAQVFPPSNSTFCVVDVYYADGNLWQSPGKQVAMGRISWTFRIPWNAALGPAGWSIRCGPLWHRDGRWRVAAAVPAT
jgi:hypothetical protein